MPNPSLAPRTNNTRSDSVVHTDPFATPTLNSFDLPAVPYPTAYTPPSKQPTHPYHSQPTNLDGRTPPEFAAYKSASLSSTGNSSTMTGLSSIDLEKKASVDKAEGRSGPKKQRRASRDPEKAIPSPTLDSPEQTPRENVARIAYLEDDDYVDESKTVQEEKALRILLFLSGPCVVLSFLNSIWTFISLLITTLTQPVRLCARRPSFGQQLGGLVGPALNLQLKSISTPLPPHADEDSSYRPGMLMSVMLLSPFLSLGMMIAAWVAAVYWASSAVVGDPAGMDKRDDGRETVLGLRDWWERWLVRSMRED